MAGWTDDPELVAIFRAEVASRQSAPLLDAGLGRSPTGV